MFGVFHGIPTGRKEIEAHIAALTGTHSSAEHQALFGHLYSSPIRVAPFPGLPGSPCYHNTARERSRSAS